MEEYRQQNIERIQNLERTRQELSHPEQLERHHAPENIDIKNTAFDRLYEKAKLHTEHIKEL